METGFETKFCMECWTEIVTGFSSVVFYWKNYANKDLLLRGVKGYEQGDEVC